ncbi:MAG: hypothetical protein K0S00_3980 [Xanthobacteraceae bacterium]|jgi:hypothetical protein|nr:hypothetical protein [Xanthobacteraceae bacterium]
MKKNEFVPGAAEYMQSQINIQLPALLGGILDDVLTRFPQADPEDALTAMSECIAKHSAATITAVVAKHSVAVEAARFGGGVR